MPSFLPANMVGLSAAVPATPTLPGTGPPATDRPSPRGSISSGSPRPMDCPSSGSSIWGRAEMQLVILGTGTAAPSARRTAAGYWVDAGPIHLLMDCGAGALHHAARFGVPWQTVTHVA